MKSTLVVFVLLIFARCHNPRQTPREELKISCSELKEEGYMRLLESSKSTPYDLRKHRYLDSSGFYFEEFLKCDSTNPDAWGLLAWTYEIKYEYGKALELLNDGLKNSRVSSSFWIIRVPFCGLTISHN